jgi:nitronate monooxygenase
MVRPLSGGRLADLLGTRHPVIQGPFGGGLSAVGLAAAVSDGGGLGSFGAHHLQADAITDLVASLRAATRAPFAVNLWVPQSSEAVRPPLDELERHFERLQPLHDALGAEQPDLTAPFLPDYDEQIAALLDAAPPVMSFVMGVPSQGIIEAARSKGIVTIGTATTVDEAVAVEAAGMSAVVASGSDAGGHRGAFLRPVAESLVGTFSLVPQIVDTVSIPVIAAGGIADGRGVAAAMVLGADGVQIGTGFLATAESAASDAHKAALHSAAGRTTVLTRAFSGRPARGILNGFVRELAPVEQDLPGYPVQNALMAGARSAAYAAGDVDRASLWAGQAAGLTRPRPAAEYLAALLAEAEASLTP